jgi:hypothetical protein
MRVLDLLIVLARWVALRAIALVRNGLAARLAPAHHLLDGHRGDAGQGLCRLPASSVPV